MVECQKVMESEDADIKVCYTASFVSPPLIMSQRENFKLIVSGVEHLLRTGLDINDSSQNKAHLIKMFERSRDLDAVVYRSSLYERAGTETQQAADNEEDRQLSAKLHCLHGMALGALGRRSLSTHPYARAKVYDLRNYTDKTHWGPFRDDGSMRVDWEMLESLMIDLAYNSDTCCPRFMPHFKPVWSDPFGGVIKHVVRPEYPPTLPMEPEIPVHLKDPYNVSGLWHRVSIPVIKSLAQILTKHQIVCFLDYNDLYAFNFSSNQPDPDQPREPIKTQEAHFTGISRSMDASWDPNANSRIRGL